MQVDESFYLLNNSTTHRAEQQQTAGKEERVKAVLEDRRVGYAKEEGSCKVN